MSHVLAGRGPSSGWKNYKTENLAKALDEIDFDTYVRGLQSKLGYVGDKLDNNSMDLWRHISNAIYREIDRAYDYLTIKAEPLERSLIINPGTYEQDVGQIADAYVEYLKELNEQAFGHPDAKSKESGVGKTKASKNAKSKAGSPAKKPLIKKAPANRRRTA